MPGKASVNAHMKNIQIYIPSIDAKDIYLSMHDQGGSPEGYSLKLKDGQYNLRKFINSLDYSLDLIELMKIYYNRHRKRDFYFKVKKHKYSVHVLNVTFKYSVKEWNQMNKKTFVKFGYDYRALNFEDCIARNVKGEIVGIRLGEPISKPAEDLDNYFSYKVAELTDRNDKTKVKEKQLQYTKGAKAFKTIKTNAQLRRELYEDGFLCDGTRYCRMKRSSGSARVGKCLFINNALFKPLLKFSSGGIDLKHGEEIDLAAFESYIALTSSSIVGVLPISPENILIIDDYNSVFQDDVIETHNEDGWLKTTEKRCEISNSIWDGQSLMDISLFGEYKQFGMVLLRNLMFKSCCFNCNVQEWFKDNGITEVSQLHGYTRARRIEDVKLITTPNSIKYLKFNTVDSWLDHLYPHFGVVKHDKKTRFFGGRLVQTHYQLINTLQISIDEMREFLRPSLDFAQLLRDNPAVVRHYINYPDIDEITPVDKPMRTRNDVVYHLMCVNDHFTKTKYYQEFLHDLMASYYKNLKNGHVYVNGNYSTVVGNPMEMLQQSIGGFNGESQIGIGNIHSTRFEYGSTILGSRSPHITIANIWLPRNRENPAIDRYLNLTDEIACVNSIGENVLQRNSGMDFDSDSLLFTDNPILIRTAQKNYDIFKTPTSFVSAKKVKRYYTPEQQADLDIKTSVNLIGEIVNLSQELNSLLWDRMYHGSSYEDIRELYYDICQLDILSGVEIDKAKKEFAINSKKELDKMRNKYKDARTVEAGSKMGLNGDSRELKKKMPHFFAHVSRQKGYYDPAKKYYCKYHTAMDYLHTVVNGFRVKQPYRKDRLPFVTVLDNSKYYSTHVNRQQLLKIYGLLHAYVNDRNNLFALDLEREDRYARLNQIYDRLVEEIEGETIGFSTLFALLRSIEDKENTQIKKILLQILFACDNSSFKKAIRDSCEEVEQLTSGGDDIYLFGMGYTITKKMANSQISPPKYP